MRNLLKSIILGFTLMLILSCSIFFVSAATIQNNGHKNLYIDINSGQYSAMASVPGWGQNAYTRYGCAWFATARARELTGKDIGTIHDGESWYNYQYANFGFTRGSTPAAKALACFVNHVAVVEIVDGDILTISEGGHWEGNSSTGYTVIRDVSRQEFESSNGGFYGYVYLGVSHEDYEIPPIGVVDECKGGAGNVFLRGWSFDRTDLSKATNIHVYIGDERHEYVYADKERNDVNNVYGCGNYHGFNVTLNTALSGTQTVRVYAINYGGRINPLLYTGTVNIASTEKYVFDINMIIDGKEYGLGEKEFTFDLYLNETKVKNDVSDYAYGAISKGATFEIKDIKCPSDYEFKGGTTRGTVNAENNIKLLFEKKTNHSHSYSSLITKQPTCAISGTKTFTCSCGDSYTETIKANGHTEISLKGKAATCTATGLTDGKKCSVCGTVTVTQESIAKKAHTLTTVKGKAATCTATGLTDGQECSVCGEVTVEQKVIAKKAHTLTTVKGKAATCTRTGLTAGKKCSVCGTVTVAQKTIAKKAHTYTTSTTKATLTKNGSVVKKCTVCGTVSSTSTIYYPKTITLSATTYTYNGKVKAPAVTVKDSKGNVLKKDTDYTVKYESGRKLPGKYTVTVTFKGKYSGTKALSFTITPMALSKVTATQTTTSVTLKWSKVTGATGYRVFQNVNGKWKTLTNTTKLTYTIKKLKAGTAYTFAVRPYTVDGKDTILAAKFTQLKTATMCKTPTLKLTSTKKGVANASWTNVAGETGYELYGSSKKSSGFKKLATTKMNVVKASKNKLTSKKTYYFKVRAYTKTDSGTVYSAWSAVKSIKIK